MLGIRPIKSCALLSLKYWYILHYLSLLCHNIFLLAFKEKKKKVRKVAQYLAHPFPDTEKAFDQVK